MNMQAILKQAQQMQQKVLKEKKEIEEKIYIGTQSFVTIEMYGNRKVNKISINKESLDKDDIELLQDMIQIAFNNAIEEIDKETEQKLGKYTNGIPGLF